MRVAGLTRLPVTGRGYALSGVLLVRIVALMLTLLATTGLVMRWGLPVDPIQVAAFALTAVAALALTAAYLRAAHH